jgi:Putative transposase/Transposase zinc-binding domain
MTSEPTQHWTVFKQIFADHWDGFKQGHRRYAKTYDDVLVEKMLGCGDPAKMGDIE